MRKIDLFPRISAALLSIVLVTLVAAAKNGSSPNFGEVRREAAISFAKPKSGLPRTRETDLMGLTLPPAGDTVPLKEFRS